MTQNRSQPFCIANDRKIKDSEANRQAENDDRQFQWIENGWKCSSIFVVCIFYVWFVCVYVQMIGSLFFGLKKNQF